LFFSLFVFFSSFLSNMQNINGIEDSEMIDSFKRNDEVGESNMTITPPASPNLNFHRLSTVESKTNLADDSNGIENKRDSTTFQIPNRRKRRLGDDSIQQTNFSEAVKKKLEIKNASEDVNDQNEEENKRKRIQEEEDEKLARSIQVELDNQHISSTQSRTSSDQLIAQSIAIEEQQNSIPNCFRQFASRFLRSPNSSPFSVGQSNSSPSSPQLQ